MSDVKIHIFTDNSPVADRSSVLLFNGIKAAVPAPVVHVKNLACSVRRASQTDFEHIDASNFDKDALNADIYLFPTTGVLSLFEKHFFSEESPSHEKPLKGKKFGVLLTDKTTFDGPTPSDSHDLDSKLIEKLVAHGLNKPAIIKVNSPIESAIQDAGQQFLIALL
ncbi:hypothetical protein PHYBLDRAFT_151867 [Phycomyces blakesleeanus NRRL 1555(-)]|uniref:Uncharacterized protein n=1 Tax=Phycomyces blakesleeanus (strain ATCC 8743b / DSM 1359 / FGSC 10004 / NBRC 33097 / NRRL 1555) TaxID=763407 RepID=A0A167JYQ1_PHYB8|nr:hypothetical protein PHYBLDRAFT_151867 [Phycomyces blakesleeanus NRRL 1555(-)]OAD66930.1 hypothetical protein PHYBLDRAFT_151867 [Phycomyces blakesleeanus NRRL 1555(-)]|eukprot:XP_018284970.1 hypothetical protein PHYBLDRAFT_151867 [Phycomyces blakesleeanus NRRL 1555(-)]